MPRNSTTESREFGGERSKVECVNRLRATVGFMFRTNSALQPSTSSHVWMAPAPQEILLRVEQLSLAVMCPARWCSPDGLLALMGSANRGLITRAGSMSR
jgi:hypothetical protein